MMGAGGVDDVATMAGMRPMTLSVAAAVRKGQQCRCHQVVIRCGGGSDIGQRGREIIVGKSCCWGIRSFPGLSSHLGRTESS